MNWGSQEDVDAWHHGDEPPHWIIALVILVAAFALLVYVTF
jgi:hypothetical protein